MFSHGGPAQRLRGRTNSAASRPGQEARNRGCYNVPLFLGEWSNGMTFAFGAKNRGSIPRSPALEKLWDPSVTIEPKLSDTSI